MGCSPLLECSNVTKTGVFKRIIFLDYYSSVLQRATYYYHEKFIDSDQNKKKDCSHYLENINLDGKFNGIVLSTIVAISSVITMGTSCEYLVLSSVTITTIELHSINKTSLKGSRCAVKLECSYKEINLS